jgi:hypothetical protein
MIVAICSCGERYQVKDGLAGRRVRCLACSGPILVPGSSGDEWKRAATSAPTWAGEPTTKAEKPRNRVAERAKAPAPAARRTKTKSPDPEARRAEPPRAPAAARRRGMPDWALFAGAAVGYAAIFMIYVL